MDGCPVPIRHPVDMPNIWGKYVSLESLLITVSELWVGILIDDMILWYTYKCNKWEYHSNPLIIHYIQINHKHHLSNHGRISTPMAHPIHSSPARVPTWTSSNLDSSMERNLRVPQLSRWPMVTRWPVDRLKPTRGLDILHRNRSPRSSNFMGLNESNTGSWIEATQEIFAVHQQPQLQILGSIGGLCTVTLKTLHHNDGIS